MSIVVPMNGFGGGGTALNFKVVGGTTQPSNPKENTIWVYTNTAITGWYFSARQPENMAAGEVWFPTGNTSPAPFNALKKNGIEVYPASVKQYVSGALVSKTAKTYQNGAWVEWKNYLYNHGDMCTDITGGWTTRFATNTSSYPKGTVTENADSITIACSSSTKAAMKHTANKIDFTNIKSISITVTARSGVASNGYNGAWMFLYKNTNTDTIDAGEASIKVAITGTGTFTIDTSSISEPLYVRIESFGATFTFTEVTYEKS